MSNSKKVIGQIADASGHTDYAGTLDEAVTFVMDAVQNSARWVYVNGNPFQFEKFDAIEAKSLRDAFDSVEEPSFVLTGVLQGGSR
jgi:hypothetical protein